MIGLKKYEIMAIGFLSIAFILLPLSIMFLYSTETQEKPLCPQINKAWQSVYSTEHCYEDMGRFEWVGISGVLLSLFMFISAYGVNHYKVKLPKWYPGDE